MARTTALRGGARDRPQRSREASPQGFRPEPVPREVEHQVAREPGSITQTPMRGRKIADRPRLALGAQEDGSCLAVVDGPVERLAEVELNRSAKLLGLWKPRASGTFGCLASSRLPQRVPARVHCACDPAWQHFGRDPPVPVVTIVRSCALSAAPSGWKQILRDSCFLLADGALHDSLATTADP